jgi:hypothetical protein
VFNGFVGVLGFGSVNTDEAHTLAVSITNVSPSITRSTTR